MRNIIFSGLALVALAAPAMAADMPVKAARPVVDSYNWTGCHWGTVLGAKWGRTETFAGPNDVALPVGTRVTDPFDVNGYTSGGELGCDYQMGTFLIGVEGDYSWTKITGDTHNPLAPTFRVELNEDRFATIRGRAGILAWPNLLLYVTGGGAWTRANAVIFVPTLTNSNLSSDTATLNGWVAGAGFEMAFKGPTLFNMGGFYSIKGEYLYADFGNHRFFSPTDTGAAGGSIDYDHLRQHYLRFGINYHFDWGNTVVARY